eukprot:4584694-Prymnesium_polylepis.1
MEGIDGGRGHEMSAQWTCKTEFYTSIDRNAHTTRHRANAMRRRRGVCSADVLHADKGPRRSIADK